MVETDQYIDYMKINNDQNASNLPYVFFSVGALPVIKRPTRITHTSATLIDDIYVKNDKYDTTDSSPVTYWTTSL